jgi:hypothetical protein
MSRLEGLDSTPQYFDGGSPSGDPLYFGGLLQRGVYACGVTAGGYDEWTSEFPLERSGRDLGVVKLTKSR